MDKYPEKEPLDRLHSILKGVVSSIPLGGGVVSSILFENFLVSPVEKRKEDWLKRLDYVFRDLTERLGRTEEQLRESQVFISSCL